MYVYIYIYIYIYHVYIHIYTYHVYGYVIHIMHLSAASARRPPSEQPLMSEL